MDRAREAAARPTYRELEAEVKWLRALLQELSAKTFDQNVRDKIAAELEQ
jgi:hypothetical protein